MKFVERGDFVRIEGPATLLTKTKAGEDSVSPTASIC